jgi:hypothetical protein
MLASNNLPQWAYGPIPWPLGKLLGEEIKDLESLAETQACDRLNMMLHCLKRKAYQK